MALPAFRVAQTISGNPCRVAYYTVAAGATFKYGDPVVASGTNDEITDLADNGAAILGIALADAVPPAPFPTNIGKLIAVAEATPDVIFSAALNGAWAADLVLDNAGVDRTATVYTLDPAAGNSLFQIRGLDTTDASRVLVSVIAATSQAAGADLQSA